ncbi:positive regulation of smooth muscle cell-matrix adhesion [Porites harrisoni]
MRRKRLTNWNITTLFNWGENPEGQWKLRIENLNLKYKTTGTLYRWSLILYGTNVDPLTKNVHVPTLSTEDTAVTYSTVASPSQSTFKITTPTRESSPSGTS